MKKVIILLYLLLFSFCVYSQKILDNKSAVLQHALEQWKIKYNVNYYYPWNKLMWDEYILLNSETAKLLNNFSYRKCVDGKWDIVNYNVAPSLIHKGRKLVVVDSATIQKYGIFNVVEVKIKETEDELIINSWYYLCDFIKHSVYSKTKEGKYNFLKSYEKGYYKDLDKFWRKAFYRCKAIVIDNGGRWFEPRIEIRR